MTMTKIHLSTIFFRINFREKIPIYTIGEKCKIYAYFREKSWKKCKKLYFMRNFAFFGLAIVAAPKAAILQVLSKAKNLLASVQLATGG